MRTFTLQQSLVLCPNASLFLCFVVDEYASNYSSTTLGK